MYPDKRIGTLNGAWIHAPLHGCVGDMLQGVEVNILCCIKLLEYKTASLLVVQATTAAEECDATTAEKNTKARFIIIIIKMISRALSLYIASVASHQNVKKLK